MQSSIRLGFRVALSKSSSGFQCRYRFRSLCCLSNLLIHERLNRCSPCLKSNKTKISLLPIFDPDLDFDSDPNVTSLLDLQLSLPSKVSVSQLLTLRAPLSHRERVFILLCTSTRSKMPSLVSIVISDPNFMNLKIVYFDRSVLCDFSSKQAQPCDIRK